MTTRLRRRAHQAAFRLQVLVFEDCTPIVPVGLFDLMRKSHELAVMHGDHRAVDVALVSTTRRLVVRAAGGLEIRCQHVLSSAPRADCVVVSPFDPQHIDEGSRHSAALRFLKRAHARGATVASVCTGAFALGQSGLLDGRRAATHWAFQDAFRTRFPNVILEPQEILIDTGRVVTTGGATAFLNFALYMVERIWSEDIARAASRMFLIDERKSPQGAYAMFAGQRQHGDSAILTAQDMLERRLDESLSVETVAAEVAMARRTFVRRFKAATGSTPRDYLQRARVEAAKRRLEVTRLPISEVAESVGYEDAVAFRRIFVRHTGLTPAAYRSRYGRASRNSGALRA